MEKENIDKNGDVVITSIAKYIHKYPHQVVDMLKSSNFYVSDNANTEEIVKTTGYALGNKHGRGFATKLMTAISGVNLSASGNFLTELTAITQGAATVTGAVDTVGQSFGGKTKTGTPNTDQTKAATDALNGKVDDLKKKSTSPLVYIGIGAAVIVTFAIILTIVKRKGVQQTPATA